MNNNRQDYLVVHELPYRMCLTFKSVPPDKADLRPVFRKLGSDKCLARLKVDDVQGKKVTITLPETLACHGEGRYELCLHDKCMDCDCVEVWFEADCEIVQIEGESRECA